MGALIDIVWVDGLLLLLSRGGWASPPLGLSIAEGDLVAVYGLLEP